MLLCVCDKRLPDEAKETLSRFADLVELGISGITYEAISGHPDIFFCKTKSIIIAAPNVPEEYLRMLDRKKVAYRLGVSPVGSAYPASAAYNAAVTESFLIHRTGITDTAILDACSGLEKLSVQQGYTRCNLFPLKDSGFITSDTGIYRTLLGRELNALYVKPDGILLPGFGHGFFGGACGVLGDTVFISGSLSHYPYGKQVSEFLRSLKYDIVELYNGPLFDCGSLLFIE
ncbi:MAG: hypothetical protein V1874_12895 [Spirochaetota bacterium]